MKKTIKYSIAALVLVALMATGAYYVTTTEATYDPASVYVTIYKTELLEAPLATPVVVFDYTSGSALPIVDIVGDSSKAFGQGKITPGTYNIIKFTVRNQISFTEQPGVLNTCSGLPTPATVSMFIDPGQAADAQVPLYFATPAGGGTSGWVANGSQSTPFLMLNPIKVVAGQTTDVDLQFQTAGTVKCIGPTAVLDPPTIAVSYKIVEEAAPATCSLSGSDEFWFYHYAIRGEVPRDAFGNIVSTDLAGVILNSSAVSGWGTMTINAPDASGFGDWFIYSGNIFNATSTPGMAEHRHRLAGWDELQTQDQAYINPIDSSAGPTDKMGGTYVMNGQRMKFSFDEGGFFEGAITQDCNLFSGVSYQSGDNDMILAIKKAAPATYTDGNIVDNFPLKKYAVVQNQLEIQYDSFPGTLHNTTSLYFGSELALLDIQAGGNDIFTGWRTHVQLSPGGAAAPDYSTWTVQEPRENADWAVGMLNSMTMRDDGLFNSPNDDTVVALGVNGTGLMSGTQLEVDSNGNHRLSAGVIFPLDETASSVSDIAGTWNMSLLEQEVQEGSGGWGTGDESLSIKLSYGDVIINSNGTGTSGFFGVDAMTGDIVNAGGNFMIYGPYDECYYTDKTATKWNVAAMSLDCTDVDGLGIGNTGVSIPVFLINSIDAGCGGECPVPFLRLALDDAKRAAVLWSVMDQTGTIENSPNPGCDDGAGNLISGIAPGKQCQINPEGEETCDWNAPAGDDDECTLGDASTFSLFGVGIKIQ